MDQRSKRGSETEMQRKTYTDNLIPGAPARMVRASDSSFVGKDVCILVTFCPVGTPGQGLNFLASAFVEQGIQVVACLVTDVEVTALPANQLTVCSAVLTRMNAGHDFGAWAGVLRTIPELWQAERLFFVNDSVVGPNSNFRDLIESIRHTNADFTALTASRIHAFHAQSYFFVYGSRALQNQNVQKAWSDLPDYSAKEEVIRNCEQSQLNFFLDLELRTRIVFDLHDLFSQAKEKELSKWSPTHHLWRELCLRGFPFLKVDTFHRPKWRTDGWTQFFSAGAAEAVRLQVRESIAARNCLDSTLIAGGRGKSHSAWKLMKKSFRRYGKLLLAEWRLFRG